jgi:hypothetical protein
MEAAGPSDAKSRWKAPPEGWSPQALADALKPAPSRDFPPKAEVRPKQEPSPEPVLPSTQEAEPKAQTPPEPPAPLKPKETIPVQIQAKIPEQSQPSHPTLPVAEPLLMELPEGTPAPRKPAHEILDSILRRKRERLAKESTSTSAASPAAEASALDESGKAPAAEEPHTALVPQQVTDPREVQRAAMPGMGEVLARSGTVPMTSSPDTRPLLRVPFVPVTSAPGEERRAWNSHLMVMGIVCFVLVDVLLLVVYKDDIAGWFHHGDTAAVTAPANETAFNGAPATVAKSHSAGTSEAPQGDLPASPAHEAPAEAPVTVAAKPPKAALSAGEIGAIPTPPPSVSPAPETAVPAPAVAAPTITAPADFPPGSVTLHPSIPGPVPMAIPLPNPLEEGAVPAPPLPPRIPSIPSPPEAAPSSAGLPVPPLPNAPSTAASDAAGSVAVATPSSSPPAGTPPMALPSTELPVPATPAATPAEAAVAAPSAPAKPRKVVGKLPAEAKSALQALENFLDAADWKARSAFVQKPDLVRPAMEKHASTEGDGPIVVEEIDFLERYPSKTGIPPYCMFEVSGGSLKHPVLTLVEQSTKDGVRVDWEAFTEFKDDLLLHFLENKGAPPQKFRGLLRRKHYFDKDVPDIAGKDSFELGQPNARFEGHVFVPRNSALGKQLANQLPWGQDMPVIAELVWKSDAKIWWVQIDSIVSYGWRG